MQASKNFRKFYSNMKRASGLNDSLQPSLVLQYSTTSARYSTHNHNLNESINSRVPAKISKNCFNYSSACKNQIHTPPSQIHPRTAW